jgi:hypothetical protein
MTSRNQYFKNRNGIFHKLKLNLRWEQWSNILIWQLFENLPKIKYFLAYVNRSIGPTIKIILSIQDNFCRTFATVRRTFGMTDIQIKIFEHCSHRKFSLRKIPFLFLKYCYGDFSNCRKGISNPYLYYAFNNELCMAKFQAIICHRSFVEIKMLGLRYVAGGRGLKTCQK